MAELQAGARPGKGKSAGFLADDLIAVFQRAQDHESLALIHYLQGQACGQNGRFAEAHGYFQEALQIERQRLGPQRSSALVHRLQLARAALLAHGEHLFPAALAILEELTAAGDLGPLAGEALSEKGFCLLRLGRLDSAEGEIRRGLALLREQRQPASLARGLQYLGLLLWRQAGLETLKEAAQVLLEGAELARHNPGLRAQLSDSLGRVYSRQGKYAMAVRWFKASLKDKEAVGDRAGMATSCGGLGEAHLRAGQFAAAIESYRLDLELVHRTAPGDHSLQGQLHCMLAECYRRQGEFGRATEALERAEALAGQLPAEQRLISQAYLHLHRGRLIAQRGRFAEALISLQQAEGEFLKAGYTAVLAALRVAIGEVQLRLRNFAAAREALTWAEAHESDPYEQQFLYGALAELARLENDPERFNLYVARHRYLVRDFEGVQVPAFVPHLPAQEEEYQLLVLAGPEKILPPGVPVALRVQVRNAAGHPCAGIEVQLFSPSLQEQGGQVRPAERLRTDSQGVVAWQIQIGSQERMISLEIRLVSASVKFEIHGRVYAISVLGAPERADALLKTLFCGLTRDIVVEKKVFAPDPKTLFLRASCRLQQGPRRSRKVRPLIKIGPQDELLAEREAYNRHIERLEATQSPILVAYGDQRGIGGLAYLSRTRSQLSRLMPLGEMTGERELAEINQALEILFEQRLAPLYKEMTSAPGVLAASYPPLAGYPAGRVWDSLKALAAADIVAEPGGGRIAIKYPTRLESPDPFALYERLLDQGQPALKSFVHGNLQARNVWVDQSNEVWIMDWRQAGERHAFFDFICLEMDLRLQAARTQAGPSRPIAAWFAVEEEALAHFTQCCATWSSADRLPNRSPAFKANLGDLALRRIYQAISRIRILAIPYLPAAAPREYLQGLLCHAARLLQEEREAGEMVILLALSLALSRQLATEKPGGG